MKVYVGRISDKYFYYKDDGSHGFGLPVLSSEDIVYTQDTEVRGVLSNACLFSDVIGLPSIFGLYEIFSTYFEGKVSNDFDMLKALFNGILNDSGYCYCLQVGVTFCVFSFNGESIRILSKLQFSDVTSIYTIGRFFKRLRFEVAMKGYNLHYIRYITLSDNDLKLYGFDRYMDNAQTLAELFGDVEGLRHLPINVICAVLSNSSVKSISANLFVEGLSKNIQKLGLKAINGKLECTKTYYRDYSSRKVEYDKLFSYGIIIDCEGKSSGVLAEGCSAMGGVIFARYDNTLVSLQHFFADDRLLEETMLTAISNFDEFTKQKFIPIVTYGSSDETMLRNISQSKRYLNLLKRFRFIDCSGFVQDYAKGEGVLSKDKRLRAIGEALEVYVVKPLHNPINDARTLFNILAHILQVKGIFPI